MIRIANINDGFKIAHLAGTGYDAILDCAVARITGDGNLLGGFVFNGFNKASVRVHAAGYVPGWLTRELLATTFDYAFNSLKVKMVLATLSSNKLVSFDMYLRGGFEYCTRVPNAVVMGDLLILSMSREQCKWLRFADRRTRRDAKQELAA